MPSVYAHQRFGALALERHILPPEIERCIFRHSGMFDVGLLGPDIFFYYDPLKKTPVGELGDIFHRQSGREFFEFACTRCADEHARAYLYGLLGHYCLDSLCHVYIRQLVSAGKARHIALESEFDRYLLALDGVRSPHTYDMGRRIRLRWSECRSAARFFDGASNRDIARCVRQMRIANRFLASPARGTIRSVLGRIKPDLCDKLVPERPVAELCAYMPELHRLYEGALDNYRRMTALLSDHIHSGTPLGEDFAPTF